nr:hypothetical protein B14D6.360 [imported] - Neurospora crassa [Neurospora crassa]
MVEAATRRYAMHTTGTGVATGKGQQGRRTVGLRLAAVCAQVSAIVARSLPGGVRYGPHGPVPLARMAEADMEELGAEMNRGRQVGFGARGLRDRRRCSLLDEPLAQFSQQEIMVREVPISMSTFIVSAVYKNRHRDASDPRWFKRLGISWLSEPFMPELPAT